MPTSNEQGPRLRRLVYEAAEAPVTVSPHCGATIDPKLAHTWHAGARLHEPTITITRHGYTIDSDGALVAVRTRSPVTVTARHHCP